MVCRSRLRIAASLLGLGIAHPALALAQGAASPPATAPAPPAVQISSPTEPPAPVPNRLNERLPAWLHLRGEFRERVEGFSNGGFDASRDDLYWLSRTRLQAAVMPSEHLSFQIQVQDARVARKSLAPTGAPFSAPVDLRLAFADVGSATGPVAFRVGRQELAYGDQRLIGHVSWLNAARTFDGAKLTLRSKTFSVDAFATSVVRILDDRFDRSGHGNVFTGLYGTTQLVGGASLEPYVFWRRDRNVMSETGTAGDLSQTTVGMRMTGKLPARFDYGMEVALQRGSLGTDDVRAWAGHWQLRESLPGRLAPKLTAEYNYASGDEHPADGVRGTFDQLYPTPHDKYGLADQVGWKNVRHVRAGLELAPRRALTLIVNYHSWWLAQQRDALYTAGGAALARGVTTSAHVGQELDLQVMRPLTPHVQFAAGYARVFPGQFLRQTTPGASYNHPYVMVTYVFLADR